MIAVVGGGISGLTLGHELARQGVDFVVLEGSDRPGGVIRSARVEGRILDWGPQRVRLTENLSRLIEDVGIADRTVHARHDLELFVYRDGKLRLVPFTPGQFLRSDVVGPLAKLRLLLEPFAAPADPKERVSTYFRRHLGDELYETLVAPLYGGLYASDPAEMEVGLSLIHVLRRFGVERSLLLPLLRRGGRIDPPPACTFRDGMETLPAAIADSLGDRLLLEHPVEGLRRTGPGWELRAAGRSLTAESVVLTTPAPVTADLLREVAPDSSGALRRLEYNPLGVVHLHAETELQGLGFQVSFSEDTPLRGVTFNDSLFGRSNLYTAYLGGARHPSIVHAPDGALARTAEREFERCTGYPARAISVMRERMPAWDVSWRALETVRVPEGIHLAGNWWSRPGLPGRVSEARQIATRLTRHEPAVA